MRVKADTALLVVLFCSSNWQLVEGTSDVAEVFINPETGDLSTDKFGSILSYIKVNEHYIVFPGGDGAWQPSPMIAHSLRKPTEPLQIKAQFKKQGLDFRVLQSSVGHVTIRPSNSSADIHTEALVPNPSNAMTAFLDLVEIMARIRTFSSGPHSVQIRLQSPIVKEPLVITLGEIDQLRSASKKLPAMQLRDLWEGTLWAKFVDRCELIKGYEALLENRLWWAELIIAIFSVAYGSAVYWLGPLDFTPWQKRTYQLTCVSSACFQIVFLAFKSQLLGIREATPLSLAFGAVYFVAFNLTNVLILCEYAQALSDEPSQREITTRRTNAGRTFNSIPSSTELRGMTRVVMEMVASLVKIVVGLAALAWSAVSAHGPRANAANGARDFSGFPRPGRHGQAIQSIEFNGITVLHEDLLHSLSPVQEKLDVTQSGIRVTVRFQFSEMMVKAKGKPPSHGSLSIVHNQTLNEITRMPLHYDSSSRTELRGQLNFPPETRRKLRKECANATCTAQIIINNRFFGRASAIELGKLRFYTKKTHGKSGIKLLTYPRLVESPAKDTPWEAYGLTWSAAFHFFLILGAGLMLLVGGEAWRCLGLVAKSQDETVSKRWLQVAFVCSAVYLLLSTARAFGVVEMSDIVYATPISCVLGIVALCVAGGPVEEEEFVGETQDEDYNGGDESDDLPIEETKKTI